MGIAHIELDDARSDEQLQNPSGRYDWGESEFHKSAPVGSQDDSHPIEGVAAFWPEYSVDGYLAADEIDEESDGGVEYFLFIVDEAGGLVDGGKYFDGWFQQM